MQVLACQFDIVWEDKAPNHAKVCQMLERAEPEPGALVVLPEMFATGFSMNATKISDSATRETQGFLAETAARYKIYLAGGVVTDGQPGWGRNECVVYDPAGRELARYCKIRPFSIGGETSHYESGTAVCLFEWGGFKVAPFICYDLRFPEIFRIAAARGANLLLAIASWPAARIDHWTALLKARAIENQAYVVGVNRCGSDPHLQYPGQSVIFDPHGKALAQAGSGEETLSAILSLADWQDYRSYFPVLADMLDDCGQPDIIYSQIS
jgi:predicted amidohydrolase